MNLANLLAGNDDKDKKDKKETKKVKTPPIVPSPLPDTYTSRGIPVDRSVPVPTTVPTPVPPQAQPQEGRFNQLLRNAPQGAGLTGQNPVATPDDIDAVQRIGTQLAQGLAPQSVNTIQSRTVPADPRGLAQFNPQQVGADEFIDNTKYDDYNKRFYDQRDYGLQNREENEVLAQRWQESDTPVKRLLMERESLNRRDPYDNDSGVWGRIREALGNALFGVSQGYQQMRASGQPVTWQGLLGGAVGGVGGGIANPAWDEQRKRTVEDADLKQRLAEAMQVEQAQANNEILRQKPINDRFKLETDAQYKADQISLGSRKADELKVYRDALIQLREQGVDQNDRRIKVLEQTIEERKRANAETEKDKDLDRDARIRVAEIMANNRVQVANINQAGANYRNTQTINANREKFQVMVAEREAARAAGNTLKVREIDAKIAAAKAKATQAGMDEATVNAIFGGN